MIRSSKHFPFYPAARDGNAGRAWLTGAGAWIAAGLVLATHGLVLHLVPRHSSVISLVFLVLVPVLSAGACARRGIGGGAQGWWLLALALVLWAAGMAANLLLSLAVGNSSGETSMSMLFFVLYGVPIIFATASPRNEAWPVRLVDAVLALALGLLFFVHTFAFSTMAGASQTGEASLRLMFDIENLFIAVFALVRCASSRARAERDAFKALSIFAVLYLACAAYMNHMQFNTDYGGPVDLVIDGPFLVLMVLALAPPRSAEDADHVPRKRERLVQAASPLMLPAMLLAVSAALLTAHPDWAVAGFAMATLVYGLRNVLAHLRNLDERDRLEQLAQIDGLTGLPNRRCFDETLKSEWSRARRAGTGIALLMIDIDHFKQLNDTFGHPEGDRRLRDVAKALSACATRASDLVARYGGEEFVAILPCVDTAQAGHLADIMRLAVHGLDLPSPAPAGRVTVSIGVTWMRPHAEIGADQLIAAADKALYEAKRDGRNSVRIHEPL